MLAAAILVASGVASAENLSQLLGAWQRSGGDQVIDFTEQRMITRASEGRPVVRGIEKYEGPRLLVRHSGKLEEWKARIENGKLLLDHGPDGGVYVRLDHVPEDLKLGPLKLGNPRPLAAERVEMIQHEVAERLRKDQAAIKDEQHKGLAASVIAENARFLTTLVQEVGWLDAGRFGAKTSVDAVILAKHSGDLSLMMAALPLAEKDLKHNGDGQTFAVLYDGLQIDLGGKQRYGTQIGEDAQGHPYVLPLETPAKVDEYLKDMGLPPFSAYLADASKYLYDGKPIRMPRDDE
jgi:hypothetical protein